jgi:hypothetical protein
MSNEAAASASTSSLRSLIASLESEAAFVIPLYEREIPEVDCRARARLAGLPCRGDRLAKDIGGSSPPERLVLDEST